MKFKTKTILGIAIIEGVLLTFLGVSLNQKLRETNSASVQKRVDTTERLLFASLKDAMISYDMATIQDVAGDMLATGDLTYINILDANNKSLTIKGNLPSVEFYKDSNLIDIKDGVFDREFTIEVSGQNFGKVQFGFDVKEMLTVIEETKNWTLLVALLEIVLVALFSYILGVYLTKQLTRLRDTSLLVAQGDLNNQIPIRGNDELAQTSIAFNNMINQLKKAREDQISHQESLQLAVDKAEQANQAKSRFLATMSHELRTPLNGILGMAQLLKNEDISQEEKEEYVNILLTSGNHLLIQLNEILDFSKIESGKMELTPTSFSFENFLTKLQVFSPMAHNKNLELHLEHQINLQQVYFGDYDKLWKIVANFVTNAIKFTEKGEVKVFIHELESKPDYSLIQIKVSDTGVGIPADKIDYIFEPFTQIDEKMNRKYDGTGLGLAIVKKFAQLIGAEIHCQSTYQQGSNFDITVKLNKIVQTNIGVSTPKPQTTIATSQPKNSALKVLVVEDNPNNRKIIELLLQKLNINPAFQFDGLAGFNHIQEGNQYDVILMDLMMPNMDGITATQAIRNFEKANKLKPTPIVAVTASSYDDDKDKCLNAGMNDFIAKPISINSLKQCLDKIIANKH